MRAHIFVAVFGCTMLFGCATQENNYDPIEPVNRVTYAVNKAIDKTVIKPVSQGYNHLPHFIRASVRNFFNNVYEIPTTVNNVLQLKWKAAVRSTSRFVMNTTMGGLGFVDVAGHFGVQHKREDFGQTLGAWGYEHSAYVVLPLFGPSTARDAGGMVFDYATSVWPHVQEEYRYVAGGLYGLSTRAELLDTEKRLSSAFGTDEYAFMRNAYLQNRAYAITGALPEDDFPEDDFWDEE